MSVEEHPLFEAGLAWGYEQQAIEEALCKLLAKHSECEGLQDIDARYTSVLHYPQYYRPYV